MYQVYRGQMGKNIPHLSSKAKIKEQSLGLKEVA